MSGNNSNSISMFSTGGSYQYRWSVGSGVAGITYGPVIVPEPSTCVMAFGGSAVVGCFAAEFGEPLLSEHPDALVLPGCRSIIACAAAQCTTGSRIEASETAMQTAIRT